MLDKVKNILKANLYIGGGQVIQALLGIVRNKFAAILIGPAGFGLLSIFNNLIELIRTITSSGIHSSSVKDIAQTATKDIESHQKTCDFIELIFFFNNLTIISGIIILLLGADFINNLTFGDKNYVSSIRYLTFGLIFFGFNQIILSVIQGLRLSKAYFQINAICSFLSTVASVSIYYFLGIEGIVLSIILSNAIFFFVSYYILKKNVSISLFSFKNTGIKKIKETIKLGFYITVSSLITTLIFYFIRLLILNRLSLEFVGYFQAAWTVSVYYVGIILNSLAIDYFPRLSSVIDNPEETKNEVNTQAEIGMILAAPLISFMLCFSEQIIKLIYSSEFLAASNLMSLFLIANFIKFFVYPMSYLMLSKGEGNFFLFIETISNIALFSLMYFGFSFFNFIGIGIGYVFLYLFYMALIVIVSAVRYKIKVKKRIAIFFSFAFIILLLQFLIFYSDLRNGMPINIAFFAIIFLIDIIYSEKIFGLKNLASNILKKKN